jgi:hypothetical protein
MRRRSLTSLQPHLWTTNVRAQAGVEGSSSLKPTASAAIPRASSEPPFSWSPPPPHTHTHTHTHPPTPTEKAALEGLTNSLGVPLGTAKAMVFRRKALLNLTPGEILDRVAQVGGGEGALCVSERVGLSAAAAPELGTAAAMLPTSCNPTRDAASHPHACVCEGADGSSGGAGGRALSGERV